MDSRILNIKGISVLEVLVAVAILGMLFAMVIVNANSRINKSKLERTVNEMMSIAQASLDYHNTQGSWPETTSDLTPAYMSAVSFSPFEGEYQINNVNNTVTVSTTVPSGLAKNYFHGALLEVIPGVGQDTIEITQQLPNEFSGRLEYEKKYRYQQ